MGVVIRTSIRTHEAHNVCMAYPTCACFRIYTTDVGLIAYMAYATFTFGKMLHVLVNLWRPGHRDCPLLLDVRCTLCCQDYLYYSYAGRAHPVYST